MDARKNEMSVNREMIQYEFLFSMDQHHFLVFCLSLQSVESFVVFGRYRRFMKKHERVIANSRFSRVRERDEARHLLLFS